jgi:allophanate hydrolase
MQLRESLDFKTLHGLYAHHPQALLRTLSFLRARISDYSDPAVWISRVDWDSVLARAEALLSSQAGNVDFQAFPLFGIPFAVKDNIDVAGMITTVGCPAIGYPAKETSPAVARLELAGAILIGKTNMDQFATGLVGTRSPYGAVRNVFKPEYISGGSSSGSAVAVAAGLVSFALGTDTAGSGRVPAGFNNIVGLKPTRGLVSTKGVFPACRSLDCVSVFALTCEDASTVFKIAQGPDKDDAFSRSGPASIHFANSHPIPNRLTQPDTFRFGIPDAKHLEFFGDRESHDLFFKACVMLESMGGVRVTVSFAPFAEAASLLYQGPWLAERQVAFGEFMDANPTEVLPVIRNIMAKAKTISAVDGFKAYYKLKELKAKADSAFNEMDFLLVPTAPNHYTLEEVLQDPIQLNARLGLYTNFVNLFDLSALAVPALMRANGLPFGITMIGKAFQDQTLSKIGYEFQKRNGLLLGATPFLIPNDSLHKEFLPLSVDPIETGNLNFKPKNSLDNKTISLAVAGLHLSGQPLNSQLTILNAKLIGAFKTAPYYRFYAIPKPGKTIPGLVRQNEGGASIEVEVWELTEAAFGAFMVNVNPPLCIGGLELESGIVVKGFLCEAYGIQGAREITQFGSWRAYLGSKGLIS